MASLDGQVAMLELYHRLGVRQMLIAYNLNNAGGARHAPFVIQDRGVAAPHAVLLFCDAPKE